MKKTEKLILIGGSAFAQIAYEYFTHDSPYEVVAFSVERAYIKETTLFGLPIVPFETLQEHYDPASHSYYAANVYTQLNRLRTRLYEEAKRKGYKPASYISSQAFVWRNVEIGEHCFIFEGNVVQPFVKLGNNVVLWSGNHIGHHSTIGDNCFVASHAVISGFVTLGKNCFVGVNATLGNNLTVGDDCVLGAGAIAVKDVAEDMVLKGVVSEASPSGKRFFKVKEGT